MESRARRGHRIRKTEREKIDVGVGAQETKGKNDQAFRCGAARRPAGGWLYTFERREKLAARLESLRGFFRQTPAHDSPKRFIGQWRRILRQHRSESRRRRWRFEWTLPRDGLVEHAAEREDVGRRCHRLAPNLLGRHVS